jgi:hypothetical protein
VDCDLEGVEFFGGGCAVRDDVDVVLAEVDDGDAAGSVEAPLWWDGVLEDIALFLEEGKVGVGDGHVVQHFREGGGV